MLFLMSLGHLETREGQTQKSQHGWGNLPQCKALVGKHPSQSLVTGLQGKPTEQKTGISLDYLTPGLAAPQERIHMKDSRAELSASPAQAGLTPPARAEAELGLRPHLR